LQKKTRKKGTLGGGRGVERKHPAEESEKDRRNTIEQERPIKISQNKPDPGMRGGKRNPGAPLPKTEGGGSAI